MTQTAVEQPQVSDSRPEVQPPTLEENLLKASGTLENVVQCLKIQVLNNFDAFVSAVRQECPGLDRSKVDKLKTLLDHLLKSPIKRQMNRISTVALAMKEIKPKKAEPTRS